MMEYFGFTDMLANWNSQREFVINSLSESAKLTPQQKNQILIGMGPEEIQNAFTVLQNRTFTSFDNFLKALKQMRKQAKYFHL